jgi:hypothetical protein
MWARRRAPYDAVPAVERFDHPAIACVEAHVPGPPQDVSGADFVERDFRKL